MTVTLSEKYMAGVRVPSLDVQRIVDIFGNGATGCSEACQSAGFYLPVATIRKWLERKRVPMTGWLMINAAHRVRNGRLLDLNTFLVSK